jgi:hypothetical protein
MLYPTPPVYHQNTTKDMMRMYVSASWRFGGRGGEMCILKLCLREDLSRRFSGTPLPE